jgi:hypothetical protein
VTWSTIVPCLVAYMYVLAFHVIINLNHLNGSKQDFVSGDVSKHKIKI